jgi:Spy/CpxP family protein refolding chaperone
MTRAFWVRSVMTFLVASLALGGVVLAADPPRPPAGQPHGRAWLKAELGLTEEQATAIREVRKEQAEAHRLNFQALGQAQRELRRLVLEGADEAIVQAKQEEVAQLLAESVRLRMETLKRISPILTPEQRQKLAELGERGWPHRHFRHQRES